MTTFIGDRNQQPFEPFKNIQRIQQKGFEQRLGLENANRQAQALQNLALQRIAQGDRTLTENIRQFGITDAFRKQKEKDKKEIALTTAPQEAEDKAALRNLKALQIKKLSQETGMEESPAIITEKFRDDGVEKTIKRIGTQQPISPRLNQADIIRGHNFFIKKGFVEKDGQYTNPEYPGEIFIIGPDGQPIKIK